MERPILSPQTLIADILALSPKITSLFVQWQVDCIGCSMAKFCTLQEMVGYYQMDIHQVLAQLEKRITQPERH